MMTSEPRNEHSRSYGQERTYGRNAHNRPDGEVCTRNEMSANAVPGQEVGDDDVEQAGDQARRVGVAANGPIQVNGQSVGDEPCHPDERQDDPMATKTVKEQVAGHNCSNGPRVKPKNIRQV